MKWDGCRRPIIDKSSPSRYREPDLMFGTISQYFCVPPPHTPRPGQQWPQGTNYPTKWLIFPLNQMSKIWDISWKDKNLMLLSSNWMPSAAKSVTLLIVDMIGERDIRSFKHLALVSIRDSQPRSRVSDGAWPRLAASRVEQIKRRIYRMSFFNVAVPQNSPINCICRNISRCRYQISTPQLVWIYRKHCVFV